MPEPSSGVPARRQYSEEEAGLILRRAAELQGGVAGSGGMSLAELEVAAKEAGIDGALVRQAAQELRVPARADRSTPPSLLGAPTRHVFERSVQGEIDSTAYGELLTEIRRQLGDIGRVDQLGRMFAWRSESGRNLSITVTPRAGRTLVRVEENTSALAGGLLGGLGGGLGGAGIGLVIPICIAALKMPALIPVGLALWFFGVFMLARTIYRGQVNQRRVALEQLADGLADVCEALPAAAPGHPRG